MLVCGATDGFTPTSLWFSERVSGRAITDSGAGSLAPIAVVGGLGVRRARVGLQRAVGRMNQPAARRSVEVKVPGLAAPRRRDAPGSREAAADVGSLHASVLLAAAAASCVGVKVDQDHTSGCSVVAKQMNPRRGAYMERSVVGVVAPGIA